MFRHVDHWVQLIGGEHVGFGLDYVSDTQPLLALVRATASKYPGGQYAIASIPMVQPEQIAELTEQMCRHGYGDSAVAGILGGNWLRVANEVWK